MGQPGPLATAPIRPRTDWRVRIASGLSGVTAGLAFSIASDISGIRVLAVVAEVVALVFTVLWLRDPAAHELRQRRVVYAARTIAAVALAATVTAAAAEPRTVTLYATLLAVAATIAATLIPTSASAAIGALCGAMVIGVGVAGLVLGMVWVADGDVLIGVATVGVGVTTAGIGVAWVADSDVLAGMATTGMGVAAIAFGAALLVGGEVLVGVTTIGTGVAAIAVGVAMLVNTGLRETSRGRDYGNRSTSREAAQAGRPLAGAVTRSIRSGDTGLKDSAKTRQAVDSR